MAIDMQRAARLIGDAVASGASEREIPLGDSRTLRFRRAPSAGRAYTLSSVSASGDEQLFLEQFDAAAARPDGYPLDAPFVAGTEVGLVWAGGRWGGLAWERVGDPRALVDAVVADSAADGWSAGDAPVLASGDGAGVEMWVLQRGSAKRVLTVARGPAESGATLMNDATTTPGDAPAQPMPGAGEVRGHHG